MNIDFTTTAMPRPDILDECYSSFDKNLIGINLKECDLYINIDPFPYNHVEQKRVINTLTRKCVDVGRKYFKTVFYRSPKEPNYSTAYKWLWRVANSELIFNLEDDWSLDYEIDINDLIKYFNNVKTLYQVVLRAYSYKYPACCTSPSLLHERWYREISKGLKKDQNPESQIHKNNDKRFDVFVPNNATTNKPEKYIIAHPESSKKIVVSDIGRDWVKKSPYISPIEHNRELKKYYDELYRLNSIKIKKNEFVSWVPNPKIDTFDWLTRYNDKI